jgi:hypothetical protein
MGIHPPQEIDNNDIGSTDPLASHVRFRGSAEDVATGIAAG